MRKVTVLLNPSAGLRNGSTPADRAQRVRAALAGAGLEPQVRIVPPGGLAEAAQQAARSGADVVVAAGGDGTVNAVASALIGTSVPMGVLALGTLNHFAKDLGLPLELDAAAKVVASGNTKRIDVGAVNGRVFLNNSTLGLYAEVVRERKRLRRRLGKPLAFAVAAIRLLASFPTIRLRLHIQNGAWDRRTPLAFVGNNRYGESLFRTPRRATLSAGELALYVAAKPSRLQMIALAFRALFGRLDRTERLDAEFVRRLRIDSRRRRLLVTVDGEVLSMHPPLEFESRPGALGVLAP